MKQTVLNIKRDERRDFVWNLVAILVGILPLFLLLIWTYSMVAGVDSRTSLLVRFPAEFLGSYLVFVLPFVVIAGIQWLLVMLLPITWSRRVRRSVAIGTAPVASLLAVVFFPVGLLGVAHFVLPLIVALATFGAIMRLP